MAFVWFGIRLDPGLLLLLIILFDLEFFQIDKGAGMLAGGLRLLRLRLFRLVLLPPEMA